MRMPKKHPSSKANANSLDQSSSLTINQCAHETTDGRRCRMLRQSGHPALCLFHAREEQQLLESHRLGAEISASLTGRFMTATDINFVLGKLFTALSQNRISRRQAATLAYIAHLMLHSLPNLKQEYSFAYKFEQWNNMLEHSIPLSNSNPRTLTAPTPTTTQTNSPQIP